MLVSSIGILGMASLQLTSLKDTNQVFFRSQAANIASPVLGQCSPPKAYYYLYKLTDGEFPSDKFFTPDGANIDKDIVVGYGQPNSLIISDVPGKGRMIGAGNSDQDAPQSTRSFYIEDSISTGIRGWQEVGRYNIRATA
jgi:hypothetical protein